MRAEKLPKSQVYCGVYVCKIRGGFRGSIDPTVTPIEVVHSRDRTGKQDLR